MELFSTDIRIYNNTYWINQRVLYILEMSEEYGWKKRSDYKNTLSRRQLKKAASGVMPDTGRSWRWARFDGEFYYDYDRIPDRIPAFYKSRLPKKEAFKEALNSDKKYDRETAMKDCIAKLKPMVEQMRTNDQNWLQFENDIKKMPAVKAHQLTYSRALALFIKENENDYRLYGIKNKTEYWITCAKMVEEYNVEGLKTFAPDSLRNKMYNFPVDGSMEDQYAYLINGRYNNQNRKVVGKYPYVSTDTGEIFKFDLHEAVMFNLWMNPGKPNKLNQTGMVGVYDKYRDQIEEYGLDPVAERTVQFYLTRFSNKSMMALERDGRDSFNDRYVPYVPQFMPKYTGSLWTIDFSGSKILYRDIITKRNTNTGRKETKQVIKSHYMCRVVDVASGKLIGWSLSERQGERWEDVEAALLMAHDNNHGRFAMELVSDNGPVFSSPQNKAKLEMLFRKHRTIGLGNKQSNKAEFYVKMLSNISREFENWSMLGFNAKDVANQANPDYMKPSQIPLKDEAQLQVESVVNKWNATERSNGVIPDEYQADATNLHPDLEAISDKVMRQCFGYETKTQLGRSRSIMEISKVIEGSRRKMKYKVENWEQAAARIDKESYGTTDMSVLVYFDEQAADIHTLDGVYIMTAKRAELAHSTAYEATAESHGALDSHIAAKQSTRNAAKDFTRDVQEVLANIDFDEVERELTYLQRSAVNGGKAKDDHLKVMNDENDYDEFDLSNQL